LNNLYSRLKIQGMAHQKITSDLVRIGRYLNEIITIKDTTGKLLHKVVKPVMVEVYPRDIIQMIVGATLLSIPIAFTEEVWTLGQSLPVVNIIILSLLSIVLISVYIYYSFYRRHLRGNTSVFIKRVLLTYLVSLTISLIILTVIQKSPGGKEWIITLKRMIIISFPASMSASIADTLK
jgi:uncharacterized membrane protein